MPLPTVSKFCASRCRHFFGFIGVLISAPLSSPLLAQQPLTVRTPTTPLVVHDPYFSIWSFNDALTEGPTRHWTGAEQQMIGVVRVDGKSLRFMGDESEFPGIPQVSRSIWPTRVIYEFEGSGIHLTATFLTPALPQDLDILSRPITYLDWAVRSVDGETHQVQVYFAASGNLAVNDRQQSVVWGTNRIGDMSVLYIGTNAQASLAKAGDNLRIDWGWLDVAVPSQAGMSVATLGVEALNQAIRGGTFPADDDLDMPRPTRTDQPFLAVRFDLGKVTATPATRHLLLAYDDREAIEFLHRRLPDYWRRNGMSIATVLQAAERDETALRERSEVFDRSIVTDLTNAGGAEYAQLAILAYQQALGAHKLVADIDGTPLLFSKENFSNGCIDTVDVTYPTAPIFLLFNPRLLEASLRPIMEYASLPRWRWPFAPHDLGTYPLANGQVYGGGETSDIDQMPVEESGNMLILVAALAKAEGNARFAADYWSLLTKWAEYLAIKGLDPENQLSTDDFAGHLAHNANLSIKAILALGSYAELAKMLGKNEEAQRFRHEAEQMAQSWMRMATDGDHTRLAFNSSGTWSQKYNLVWDRILGLHLFPKSLGESEIAFYLNRQNTFGLPLDSRRTYTKLDWITWTATIATNQKDFEALVHPLYEYFTQTPSRVPLSDWYDTVTGKQEGFQARSVVGGVFIKMLAEPDVWRKWASQGPDAAH